MMALALIDDPLLDRLVHALSALRWTAAALAVVLVIVAALAWAAYRKNQRARLTRSDNAEL